MGILTVLTKRHGVVISVVISFRLLDILFNILIFKKIYKAVTICLGKSNLSQQFWKNLEMVTPRTIKRGRVVYPTSHKKLSMVSHCPTFGLFAYSASSV